MSLGFRFSFFGAWPSFRSNLHLCSSLTYNHFKKSAHSIREEVIGAVAAWQTESLILQKMLYTIGLETKTKSKNGTQLESTTQQATDGARKPLRGCCNQTTDGVR